MCFFNNPLICFSSSPFLLLSNLCVCVLVGPQQWSVLAVPDLLACPSYPILLVNTVAFTFPTVLAMGNLHTNTFMILSLTIFSSLITCYPSPPLSVHLILCHLHLWTSVHQSSGHIATSFCIPCSTVVCAHTAFLDVIILPFLFIWWTWTLVSSLLDNLSRFLHRKNQPYSPPMCSTVLCNRFLRLFILVSHTLLGTYLLDVCHVQYTVLFIFVLLALSIVPGIQ